MRSIAMMFEGAGSNRILGATVKEIAKRLTCELSRMCNVRQQKCEKSGRLKHILSLR